MQTPTLALIVKREKEIENFTSEPFFEVKAEFQVEDKKYKGVWHKDGETRIKEEQMAKKLHNFVSIKKL